jgi:hypothetical protein
MSNEIIERMRTTIRMKPELARRAKAYARKTDRTFTELVEDAITDLLDRQNPRPVELPPIPVVHGTKPFSTEDLKRLIEEQEFEHDMHRIGRKT